MGKLITAYSAGRANGNTEVFIKEALWAAKEAGCDVELIRLHECNIQPCKSCTKKACMGPGAGACPIGKDDTAWLIDKFLDSDGFLMGAPIWAVGPPGIISDYRDKVMGPKMDVASFSLMGEPAFVKGRAHARPGALISVGGAKTTHWTALGLPTLYTVGFSAQVEIVDHLNITGVADQGAATLYEDYLEQARRLGRNLAYAVLHPEEANTWMGDSEKGLCPGCHLDMVSIKPGTKEVCCQVCGHHGELVIEDNEIKGIRWMENDPDDRLTLQGKATHGAEIGMVLKTEYLPRREEAMENLKKYKDASDLIVRPPKC